jgi:poly-gamma-glutamate synthesis protein (capsule biosynthesis protein)
MKTLKIISALIITLGVFLFSYKEIDFIPAVSFLENTPAKKHVEEPIKILFVGDMMFDRGVANHITNFGIESIFEDVQILFQDKDMIVGNLEGTITDDPSVSIPNNQILKFTFDPQIAQHLKENNFTHLSLANNHSADFGPEGFEQTKKYLSQNNLKYFGSAVNTGVLSVKEKIGDKNICLVGYHDLYTKNPESILNEIKNIRDDCFYLVVFPHWGDEYEVVQNERQTMLAHQFIDAGADAVIGAHPHVVQQYELYKEKPIFYSLGNFVFDQDFSYNTRRGLALLLELSEKEQKFTLIPVNIDRAEVSISRVEDKQNTLDLVGQKEVFVVISN